MKKAFRIIKTSFFVLSLGLLGGAIRYVAMNHPAHSDAFTVGACVYGGAVAAWLVASVVNLREEC